MGIITDNSTQIGNIFGGSNVDTSVFSTIIENSNLFITSNTFNNTITNYLPLIGGTLSGALNLGNNNITNINTLNATTLQQGGTNVSSLFLSLNGGTLSGALNLGNNNITNINTLNATSITQNNLSIFTSNDIVAYTTTPNLNNSITTTSNNFSQYTLSKFSSNYTYTLTSNISNLLVNYALVSAINHNSNLLALYPTTNQILYGSNSYSNITVFNSNTFFQGSTYFNNPPLINGLSIFTSNNIVAYPLTSYVNNISNIFVNYPTNTVLNQTSNLFVNYPLMSYANNISNQFINYTISTFSSNYTKIGDQQNSNLLVNYALVSSLNQTSNLLVNYPTNAILNQTSNLFVNYALVNNVNNNSNNLVNYALVSSLNQTSNLFVNYLTNTASTNKFLSLTGGTLTGTLIQNANPPNIQMGAVNGHNIGVAVSAGNFSSSATSNDLILRSMNNLLLQSGTGASAITISTNNNVGINTATNINTNLYVYGTTGISHGGPIINLATVDSNNYGASTYYNTFAGDANIYSYWGVSINLNNGGNNPSGNAGYTRIPYTSSFTVNQKANGGTAGSGFTTLFTVAQNGNVGIGTTNPSTLLDVRGAITLANNVWHNSTDGINRFYYNNNGTSYFHSGNTNGDGFVFRNTAQSDIVTIRDAGNVGIGTTPAYKLDVNGAINMAGYSGSVYTYSGTGAWFQYVGTTPNSINLSMIFYHRDNGSPTYASYWWFNGSQQTTQTEISDSRSKRNIEDIDGSNISNIINKLKPKKFDVLNDKDVLSQYGFIAQDIEQIPETSNLVYTTTDYIANINSYGNHSNYYITSNIDNSNVIIDNRSVITCSDDLTNLISINDELKFVADNSNNQEFIIDATPYINRYKRRYGKVVNVISSNQFEIDTEINNFNIDDPFLVYGKKVNDFKSLDYNSIIALNTKAIQDLYSIIKNQQEQINILSSNINILLTK